MKESVFQEEWIQMMKANVQLMLMGMSLATLIGTGCKKPPPPPPPPAPKTVVEKVPEPPAKPAILSFTAGPSTVTQGSPSTLRWEITNATDISIDQGIGTLTAASGSRSVTPSVDTTYTLVAKGLGGTTSASVTVNVRAADKPIAPPPPPSTKTITRTFSESISQDLKDAYFDYDQFTMRDDSRSVLTQDSESLKSILGSFNAGNVILEGHCDERGSGEYNLALGDKRAQSALDFLKGLGVTTDRLKTVSYGKDRPQCTDASEDCYQKNRRVHFSPQ